MDLGELELQFADGPPDLNAKRSKKPVVQDAQPAVRKIQVLDGQTEIHRDRLRQTGRQADRQTDRPAPLS